MLMCQEIPFFLQKALHYIGMCFLSSSARTTLAISSLPIGLVINFLMPIFSISSRLTFSGKPEQRITGISGRMDRMFWANCVPVMFGITWSVITRSNSSGFSWKVSKASRLLVLAIQYCRAPVEVQKHSGWPRCNGAPKPSGNQDWIAKLRIKLKKYLLYLPDILL